MEKQTEIKADTKTIEPGIFGPSQPSGEAKIPDNLASQKAEEHKSKRGRKPLPRDTSGNILRPSKMGNGNVINAPSQASPNQPGLPTIDPKIIEESVKAILSAVDGTIQESVLQTGLKITNHEGLANGLKKQVAMHTEEKDMMAKLSGQVCQKYNMAGQHAPAAFLAVFAIGYSTRVVVILRQLRQLQAVAEKAGKTKNESTKHSAQAD
jgi:hypothetical protein